MVFTAEQELKEFTMATRYCNAEDEAVVRKAHELTRDAKTPLEAALNIHRWVRDHFLFGFTPVDESASETLKGTHGWCVTKTNLQVALCRAAGIPARFHQVVLTKKVLKGIASRVMHMAIKEPIWFHPWCECHLGDRWVACDLWIDKTTYEAAINAGILDHSQLPTVDWSGTEDLFLTEPWLKEDRGTMASYDQVVGDVAAEFKSIPPVVMNWLVNGSNRHTAKLRRKYSHEA